MLKGEWTMNSESIGDRIERIEGELIDCIDCGACAGKCPIGLDIPKLLHMYNRLLAGEEVSGLGEEIEAIPEANRPNKCIGCGACQFACPQPLEIWKTMGKLANIVK